MGVVIYISVDGGRWCAVHYRTKRQAVIALSTAESELISQTFGARLGIGIDNALREILALGEDSVQPVIVENDNVAAVQIAKGADIRKVRHLSIALLYIISAVREGRAQITQVDGETLGADVLTKIVDTDRLELLLPILQMK